MRQNWGWEQLSDFATHCWVTLSEPAVNSHLLAEDLLIPYHRTALSPPQDISSNSMRMRKTVCFAEELPESFSISQCKRQIETKPYQMKRRGEQSIWDTVFYRCLPALASSPPWKHWRLLLQGAAEAHVESTPTVHCLWGHPGPVRMCLRARFPHQPEAPRPPQLPRPWRRAKLFWKGDSIWGAYTVSCINPLFQPPETVPRLIIFLVTRFRNMVNNYINNI